MFRKIVLTLAATAAIGAAALTPASAGYYGHKFYGHSYYTPKYYSYTYAPYCFWKKSWVDDGYGYLVLRTIKVCR